MIETNPLRYSLTTRFKDSYINKIINPRKGDRILDIGCGVGYMIETFRQVAEVETVGLDISFESLSISKDNVGGNFVLGNAEKLPFKNDSFDKLLIADVLEHIEDDHHALDEVCRVGRDGAVLVISTPALEGALTSTPVKTFLHKEHDAFQANRRDGYRTKELVKLLKSKNIEVTDVLYTNVFFSEIFLAICKIFYYLKNGRYNSQAELYKVSNSLTFSIYKHIFFPFFLGIGRLEEFLMARWLKGHCLVIGGVIRKKR